MGAEAEEAAAPAVPAGAGQPNKILFVEGLPEATTSSMLSMLFKQFPGCVRCRVARRSSSS